MNILITGAGTGIGHDAALELAASGHQVLAIVRKQEHVAALKKLKNITPYMCDITSDKDVQAIHELEVDVLINNAAIGQSGPIARVPMKYVQANYETNVLGTMRMIQTFVPQMIKRNSGRVINVSSIGGKIALAYLGVYNMTKFALEGMSDSLRQEVKQFGIFVSVIEPGAIATGFNEKMINTKHTWLDSAEITQAEIEDMTKHHQALIKKQYSTKSVVEAIVDAVENKQPKTRYIAPSDYKLLTQFALSIPDNMRDKILTDRAE